MTVSKFIIVFFSLALSLNAELNVQVQQVEKFPNRVLLRLDLKNNYSRKIDSAKAQALLSDAEGKVVGRQVRWILGNRGGLPPMAPGATNRFYFSVPAEKNHTEVKVIVTRVVFEDGSVAEK